MTALAEPDAAPNARQWTSSSRSQLPELWSPNGEYVFTNRLGAAHHLLTLGVFHG